MGNSRYKFRAWDKENEIMICPKGILFDGRVVNFSCGMLEAFEGYEIMQYTGLKDKNGTEIYEGDIVKYPHIVGFDDIWKVEFSNGSFVIRETIVKISLRELAHKNNLEVIGNIYENPELLEESK